MPNDIQEYFQDRENCLSDLALARKKWGDKETTADEWEGLVKAMGFMVLYCPEDLTTAVNAHYLELNWRMAMLGIVVEL